MTGEPESSRLPPADLDRLSKAALVELVKLYSKLFLAMDGFWYLAIKEMMNEDTETEVDLWVWDKYARYEAKRLPPLVGAEGDDLARFATAFGYSPWFSNLNHEFTREGNGALTLTVHDCPSLDGMKREGLGREKTFCHQVEQKLLEMVSRAFNPNVEVTPVELPLKPTEDSFCCRWRFAVRP